jgi:hypothetical protein
MEQSSHNGQLIVCTWRPWIQPRTFHPISLIHDLIFPSYLGLGHPSCLFQVSTPKPSMYFSSRLYVPKVPNAPPIPSSLVSNIYVKLLTLMRPQNQRGQRVGCLKAILRMDVLINELTLSGYLETFDDLMCNWGATIRIFVVRNAVINMNTRTNLRLQKHEYQ